MAQDGEDLGLEEPEPEGKVIVLVPGIRRQQPQAGIDVVRRRFVGVRRLGLAGCLEVEMRQFQTVLGISLGLDAGVQVADDVEEVLVPAAAPEALEVQPADLSMDGGHLGGGEQREAGLLDPVVEEAVVDQRGVAALEAFHHEFVIVAEWEHEPRLDRVGEHSDGHVRRETQRRRQGGEIEGVADDGGSAERFLRRLGQFADPAGEEVDDVVGHVAFPDSGQVPDPTAAVGGESEQPVLEQGAEELVDEERVPGGAFVHEPGQGRGLVPGRPHGIGHEFGHGVEAERAEFDRRTDAGSRAAMAAANGPEGSTASGR